MEKWTPERRRQLTRDALVQAARQVFAQRGFEGASLDEIAEVAGFTRGAIYKNFQGKEDLFFAVVDDLNQRAITVFADMLEGEGQPEFDYDALADVWRRLFVGERDAHIFGLEFSLYALRNPAVRERSDAQHRRNHDLIEGFMKEQSKRTGTKFKVPIDTLTDIFLVTSDGFSHAALTGAVDEGLFAKFLELFVPAVIADPPADVAPPAKPPRKRPASRSATR